MELMPGYKQSEVGVIPEDWDVKRLREISPSQSVGLVINPSSYFEANGEVPMLVGSCISENKINAEKASRISRKNSERLSACRLKTGDLVTVRVGFPGTTAVVPTELDGCNCASMMIIRSHKSFDSYWLAQLLNSPTGRAQIENVEYGTAQKQFNISDAIDFIFPVPPPAEQSKIAEAAKSFDEYIESLEQNIDKKRGIKHAAMQELLTGKRRLPGFEGEWEVKMLKDIIRIPVTDGPHMTPRFLNTGVPFLSVNNLANNRLDFSDLRFISEEDHRTFSRKCKPQKDDILLGKAASVGKVAIVDSDTEFNIWSPIALIRITENNSPTYVYYALQGQDLVGQISLLTNASSQGNIGMGDIEKLAFRLPGKEEQTAIASTLSDLDAELAALEARMEKAQKLKQGMMQELLTGRIRLI